MADLIIIGCPDETTAETAAAEVSRLGTAIGAEHGVLTGLVTKDGAQRPGQADRQ